MKKTSIKIGFTASIIIIILGISMQLNEFNFVGGGITGSKYIRDGFDVSLSGISVIIIGFLLLLATYSTYKYLNKKE